MQLQMHASAKIIEPLCVHVVDQDGAAAARTARCLARHDIAIQTWPCIGTFMTRAAEADAGCVVIDPHAAGVDVDAVQDRLASPDVGLPSVIVTTSADLDHAVEAMRRGAIDYLLKPVDEIRLEQALDIARQRLSKARRREATMRRVHAAINVLTTREREVLEGLTRGWSNKEIARRLAISARTVEIHRANVMAKLDAESLSQALRVAFIAQVCSVVNPALHVD